MYHLAHTFALEQPHKTNGRPRKSGVFPYKAGTSFALWVRLLKRHSMKTSFQRIGSTSALRGASILLIASMLVPLAGCGSHGSDAQPPSAMSQGGPPPGVGSQGANAQRPSLGITTKQKVVLLAGAAALYYYYRKSKAKTAQQYAGQTVQYYRSATNGRIYYRDPKTHQAIYVTAPSNQVQVPEAEAQPYQQIQGYNGQSTGNKLDYYFNGANGAANANAQ